MRELLARKLGGLPPPAIDVAEEVRNLPPRPTLSLSSERLRGWSHAQDMRDLAMLRFDYDGALIGPGDQRQSLRRAEGDRVVVVPREPKAERAAERRLRELGLQPAAAVSRSADTAAGKSFTLQSTAEVDWWQLVHRGLPALEAEGWAITVDPSFRHRVVAAAGDWEASLGATAGAWFSLDLGIVIEGERIPLLPVLAQAVRHLEAGPDGQGRSALPRHHPVRALDDGRVIALPTDRVGPMLETLIELFDARGCPRTGRSTSRRARPWLWPSTRRPCSCAGSAPSAWLSLPNACVAWVPWARPSRRRDCGRPCAATSGTAWPGCSSSPGWSWAGSWPTIWAWARRSRRWRTS